jgi:hypothetical protein
MRLAHEIKDEDFVIYQKLIKDYKETFVECLKGINQILVKNE